MRKSRFTDAQIIGMIKEQEAGLPTADLCRKHGLSPATFYKLKTKYGGMRCTAAYVYISESGLVRCQTPEAA
jgi:putative transposase